MKYLDLSYYNSREPNTRNYYPITSYLYINNLVLSKYGELLYNLFCEDLNYSVLERHVLNHGYFFKDFLYEDVKEIVAKKITTEKFKHLIPFYKETRNYNYEVTFEKYMFGNVSGDLMNVFIGKYFDKNLQDKLDVRNLELKQQRTCHICGNLFKPIQLPEWVYYGSSGNINICYSCPVINNRNKKSLKFLIKELVGACNFIPNSSFNIIDRSFSSRVNPNDWVKVSSLILSMGITGNMRGNKKEFINKIFGSWFMALVVSGVLKNNILKGGRGFKCVADSGNVCNSLDEQYIDNFLFKNGYNLEKEPLYPFHEIYNPNNKLRADWKIGNTYIEYFGLAGDFIYDEKIKRKCQLAEFYGLKLISIFPKDLIKLNEIFKDIR